MYWVMKYDDTFYVWDERALVMYYYQRGDKVAGSLPASLQGLIKFNPDLEYVGKKQTPPEPVRRLLEEVNL